MTKKMKKMKKRTPESLAQFKQRVRGSGMGIVGDDVDLVKITTGEVSDGGQEETDTVIEEEDMYGTIEAAVMTDGRVVVGHVTTGFKVAKGVGNAAADVIGCLDKWVDEVRRIWGNAAPKSAIKSRTPETNEPLVREDERQNTEGDIAQFLIDMAGGSVDNAGLLSSCARMIKERSYLPPKKD